MTRYEADEWIEVILLSIIIVSFIFVAIGFVKTEAFFVINGIMFVVAIVSYYVLNWIDNREES